MANSVNEEVRMQTPTWSSTEEHPMGSGTPSQNPNNALLPDERIVVQNPDHPEYNRGSSAGGSIAGSKADSFRDKQVKPNKVYIGGLPEHTREEDLHNCFGKIGQITNIELKVGYGFVEFDSREAAEESVAKYNEGHFMGNKIKVELSHGGGRTAKFTGDPGACFRCGQMGHWARECPSNNGLPYQRRPHHEPPLIDRIQRDYHPRGPPPPRDDYGHSRYPPPPPRDSRYDYAPVPPRDVRRPPSPGYRDYPPPPPPRTRDYDDYRRGPPPPPAHQERERYPPPPDYRSRYPPPPEPGYRGYGPPPVPAAPYDRYDRRGDRYSAYPPPARTRTPPPAPPPPPPPPPPRGRDEYERISPRDLPEYRGRPVSPPHRYSDFNRSAPPPDPPAPRYRRRSESPPRPPYDYPSNGYGGGANTGPPGPSRGNPRDYPPPRNGRDISEPVGGYRRP